MLSQGAIVPSEPVARWLAVCRCVRGRWSVRLDLRGRAAAASELHPRDDLELPRDEQLRLLALWTRRDRSNHFQRLGLAPTADAAAIRRAYLATCRQFHPDRYYGKRIGPFAEILASLFDDARAAYEVLSDPRRRAEVLTGLDGADAAI